MASKIHYEENTFLLKEMLKTLRRGCSLDIDASIFLEYSINQLLFINKALKELSSSIIESPHLRSPQIVRELFRLTSSFTGFLDDMIDGKLKFSEYCRNYTDDFIKLSKEHHEIGKKLSELLEAADSGNDSEQLVSEEEFKFLFDDEKDS